jgi:ferredoxin
VDAIISDNNDDNGKWMEVNKKYADIWPNISEKKDPPTDHKKFKDVKNKYEEYFKENLE